MGSLREKIMEDEHMQALMTQGNQSMIARLIEEVQRLVDINEKLDERLNKLEAWIEHEDTRALEESEY